MSDISEDYDDEDETIQLGVCKNLILVFSFFFCQLEMMVKLQKNVKIKLEPLRSSRTTTTGMKKLLQDSNPVARKFPFHVRRQVGLRKWRSSKNSDLPIMNQKKKCITREYPGPWYIEIYYDVIDIKLVTTKGLAFPNKLGSLTDYL